MKGVVLNVAEADQIVDGEIEYGIDRSANNFKTLINTAVELFLVMSMELSIMLGL